MDDYIKREDELIKKCDAKAEIEVYFAHIIKIDKRRKTKIEAMRIDLLSCIGGMAPVVDVRENVYADCLKLNNDPYIMWKCGNCGWIRERTSKPKFCEECGAEFLPAVRGEKYV